MALTDLQRGICRLLAAGRIQSDLFHDTAAAVEAAWAADRRALEGAGYRVVLVRERAGFVEVEIERGSEAVAIQWTQDSAFRFFPLIEHSDLGLTLHPFDLATNKLLAMVGRLEPRDWVDVIASDQGIQPLGYLAWAACGKDPGFSPAAILDHAARSSRYSPAEMAGLAFEGTPPDLRALSQQWHLALGAARRVVDRLPAEEAGKGALTVEGDLFRGDADALGAALAQGAILFHGGAIRGAFPQVVRSG